MRSHEDCPFCAPPPSACTTCFQSSHASRTVRKSPLASLCSRRDPPHRLSECNSVSHVMHFRLERIFFESACPSYHKEEVLGPMVMLFWHVRFLYAAQRDVISSSSTCNSLLIVKSISTFFKLVIFARMESKNLASFSNPSIRSHSHPCPTLKYVCWEIWTKQFVILLSRP